MDAICVLHQVLWRELVLTRTLLNLNAEHDLEINHVQYLFSAMNAQWQVTESRLDDQQFIGLRYEHLDSLQWSL
ncbi:hypothetical protein FPSE_00634 [Fusarium pseudograminearum CS3096]|uniref:Uncharacterized protein n=1 Tax=Fusarium pseudograminearum (strain CS3096) TaxID=1028729 RepID=K3VU90_FUSPC|nr:hypothetical protein FPSE_00634 [Fusarium pseudograminearum CS3096]EKJ79159.1 hypothetical protein FPSE_00634 [Fusarium pseudograminearum CS3096]